MQLRVLTLNACNSHHHIVVNSTKKKKIFFFQSEKDYRHKLVVFMLHSFSVCALSVHKPVKYTEI